MALVKLDFQPGINKENTPYSTEGSWEDADKIRFRSGKPEKLAGWVKMYSTPMKGVPRATHTWRVLDGNQYTAYSTSSKFYIDTGGVLTDVTPLRTTASLTNPFTTTLASTTITVAHSAHGAQLGAFVTYSGVAAAIDGIPAAEFNTEHEITRIVNANVYEITVTTPASVGGVTAGGTVTAEYQINPGAVNGIFSYGFGSGAWGASTWGTPRTAAYTSLYPRVWSIDNWGEDLVTCPREGPVYLWDASNPTARMTIISQAPQKNNRVMVTNDRHLVCLGCNQPGAPASDLDNLQIRWSSQEDYTDWTPTVTNTAGDYLIDNGTEILSSAVLESQCIIWTDEDVHSMQFIGPPYTFGFQKVGVASGIGGPNAWVAHGAEVYWMGKKSFYAYSGGVLPMKSTVQKFVFDNINMQQQRNIFVALNKEYNEITWFYPTVTIEDTELNGAITASDTTIRVNTTAGYRFSGEILIDNEYISYTGKTDSTFTGCVRGIRGSTAVAHDDDAVVSEPNGLDALESCRYVSYSLAENSWWTGRLERTAWENRGSLRYPIATSRDGYIYLHEYGVDADGLPMASFIQSSEFDIGEGDSQMLVSRVIPDFFLNGDLKLKMRTRDYPLGAQTRETIGTVSSGTTKINTRIRGRQMALRIESDGIGDDWRYGATRIDQRPDGRR